MNARAILNSWLKPLGVQLYKPKPWAPSLEGWTEDVRSALGHAPQVVLDVGANIGQAASQMLAAWPAAQLFCFEPNPVCFAQLQARFALQRQVTALPLGIGAQPQELSLNVLAHSPSSSFLPTNESAWQAHMGDRVPHNVVQQVRVPVITLDQFCQERGLTSIDCLKSDTQGYDLEVLKGAQGLLSRRAIRSCVVETNFAQLYQGQGDFYSIVQYLRGLGYVPGGFYDVYRSPQGPLIACDTLFFPSSS